MSATSTTGRAALVAASVGARVPRDRGGRARRPAEPPQGELSHAEARCARREAVGLPEREARTPKGPQGAARGGERRDCCQCENVANTQSQYPIGIGNNGTGNTSTMATFSSTPKGWEVRRIGWLMSIKPSISAPHEELLSVFLHKGVIRFIEENEKRTNVTSTDLSKYQLVEPGDFVMNNQQAWRGSVGVSRYRGIVSPAYFVMRLADCLKPDFANYLLRSRRVVSIFERCSRGVGTIQRNLIWDMLKVCRIAFPPLPEQKAIVAYLDAETWRIDKAIAAEEKMIALLQERLQGVLRAPWDVAEATPCKPWETRRAKFIWKQLTAPSSSLRKIGLENIESFTGRFIESASQFEGSGIAFEKGDILYGKLRPYLAKVWIAEFAGNAVGDFFVYRLNGGINARYLQYYMRSPQFTEAANASTYGAKMPRVSADYMANFPIPLPPLPEQEAIVARLDRETGKIDRAIEVKRRQIELLRERRQIVIDEAVRGEPRRREALQNLTRATAKTGAADAAPCKNKGGA